MTRVAQRVRIDALPATIWAVLIDVERWPAWASQFSRLERLDDGPLALGTRVRVKPNGQPASTWIVIDYDAERLFTWASSLAPGIRVTGGHELTPAGESTEAEFWLEAQGPLGMLLSPVLRRTIFKRNTRAAAEGLKRHVESGQVPASG